MANAELVVLVLPGQEKLAGATIAGAQREFALRPYLGLLGFGGSRSGGNRCSRQAITPMAQCQCSATQQ